MGGRLLFAALCAAAALASPAWGAPADVNLGANKTISPVNVTIDPGESVTWHWVGPDTNHTSTSFHSDPFEVWDSDPDVPANDVPDHPVGRTFGRVFNEPGSYFYGCKVHAEMRGTVTVTGVRPTAAFSASTLTPLTAQEVTFDASGSGAPAGQTITKYEWDLDGNAATGIGGFEADTGTTPSAASTYATTGARIVRLQVTDSAGHHNRTSQTVTVRTRVPSASFTVSPNPAQKGQLVTFSSTSTDPDDAIVKHEWDLDGDGVLETDTGDVAAAAQSYPAAGPRTIRLRVTDAAGNVSPVVTRPLTVSNALPTASFTAAPDSLLVEETAQFDASASSDPPPGAIANYRWDLDGSPGTGPAGFETDTGTTPTTSRAYSSAGSVTVRLQVTDDDGATATTSRTVTVSAPPQPPPPPPPPARQPAPASTPPADPGMPAPITTALTPRAPVPPLLALGGSARQRLAARRPAILITARCDGRCELAAGGRLTIKGVRRAFGLRAARATLGEAGQARLRLAVPPSAVKAVKKALRRRKRVAAVITVTATGPGGAVTARRAIRLR